MPFDAAPSRPRPVLMSRAEAYIANLTAADRARIAETFGSVEAYAAAICARTPGRSLMRAAYDYYRGGA